MPSPELWAEFPVIAVALLLIVAIGVGLRSIFHELTTWQDCQDKKRGEERERQRQWETAQELVAEQARNERDRHQREFFDAINERNVQAINGNGQAIKQLVELISKLLGRLDDIDRMIQQHDQRAERIEKNVSNGPRKGSGKGGGEW